MHPSNHRMADVFRDSGFAVEVSAGPGLLHFEFPASLDADALAAFEDRDRIAAVAAVTHVLRPPRWRSSAPRAGPAASAPRCWRT